MGQVAGGLGAALVLAGSGCAASQSATAVMSCGCRRCASVAMQSGFWATRIPVRQAPSWATIIVTRQTQQPRNSWFDTGHGRAMAANAGGNIPGSITLLNQPLAQSA